MEKISKNGKTRFFSVLSYLSVEELAEVMQQKSTSVRAWACINHDKDKSEPHRHLVVRLYGSWTPTQFLKWFPDVNSQGEAVNTFCEAVKDRTAICEYLTHENDESKYHYDMSEVIDHGLNDILPSSESSDDTFEIVEKMIEGVSIHELVRLYGRDFVYHYGSYVAIVNAIKEERATW